MQKKITPSTSKGVLRRALLPFLVLCISFHASVAQKQPARSANPNADAQRKKADAASHANPGQSAAFSDAVAKEPSLSAKPNQPAAKNADAGSTPVVPKRKIASANKADAIAPPKGN